MTSSAVYTVLHRGRKHTPFGDRRNSLALPPTMMRKRIKLNSSFLAPMLNDTARPRQIIVPTATTAHQSFKMNVILELDLEFPDGFEPPSEDRSHFVSVTLTDTSGFLTQDVTLVVSAMDLDSTRCFMERHPSLNHETIAMALTFVPRFTLPDFKGEMEYGFLVDRSGSMRGERIRLVREALVVLLRGLPTFGTTFNIISFGTNATKLWDTSRQYSQTTLEEATNHYVLLGITESVQEVETKLAAVNIDGDVGATVLAWAWMDGAESVGDEVLGMKEKAREWVEGRIERTEYFLDVKEKVVHAMTSWMW
ncbi:hypothetical protein F5890DRAFT_1568050 [Lentinula detonsa]|uniref:VWFA domain-containing protein n=1 Tax=Lentinula detonsa TaxID=2804962 RepID=A0AA38PTC9_9AGAR|nr:hypothetical protein F5890DRAFT_1568050 [Lentinula detonsa]